MDIKQKAKEIFQNKVYPKLTTKGLKIHELKKELNDLERQIDVLRLQTEVLKLVKNEVSKQLLTNDICLPD